MSLRLSVAGSCPAFTPSLLPPKSSSKRSMHHQIVCAEAREPVDATSVCHLLSCVDNKEERERKREREKKREEGGKEGVL